VPQHRRQRRSEPYHHGNLRRVLVDAALAEIADRGPTEMSMRELARRAGVSHAAPAHHFGDKAGLLTAIAVEGFERLTAALRSANERGGFAEVGLAYIAFAVDHPAHFDVMYHPDLYRTDDPAVLEARDAAAQLLYGPAQEAYPDRDAFRVGIAGWSFAHGFASLWTTGNLRHRLQGEPVEAARVIAEVLFQPASPRA
jgi:AcrR family transcriptional regulator